MNTKYIQQPGTAPTEAATSFKREQHHFQQFCFNTAADAR